MKKGTFRFTVTVEVELEDGRESTREYVAEDIRMYLDDDSNPGYFYPDDNAYEVKSWKVAPA